jgi:prevent-host-death family protein
MKPQDYSVAEARDKLAKLVHQAERGRPVRITRRGKLAAVLVSAAEFDRGRGRGAGGPGDAILAWRAKHGGLELSAQEIESWRDRSRGRVPDLSDETE